MLRRQLFKQLFAFSSGKQGGCLWTWGVSSAGAGINQETQHDQLVPRKVEGFDNNVAKVVTGRHYSALITTNGDLYTFGLNHSGQLGVGTYEDQQTPQQVEFFRQHGLRVNDVSLGTDHSVAVTHDGSLWVWGYNGKSKIPFWNNFFPGTSGLGESYDSNLFEPSLVESFKGRVVPQHVSAGHRFTIVHDQDNNLWGWGASSNGELGNGFHRALVYPELNPVWKQIATQNNVTITKIRSCGKGTVALLSNGNLIGWGGNNLGNLGVRQQEFVRTDFQNFEPLEINRKYMKEGEKVVDFDFSVDNLTILTDQNNVYFSGIDLFYVPYLVPRGFQEKVTKVASGARAFALLTESGDLWVSHGYISPVERVTWGTLAPIHKPFQGGKVLDLGGSYNVRYAIVQH